MEVRAVYVLCFTLLLENVVSGTPFHAAGETSAEGDTPERDRSVIRIRTQGLFRGRKAHNASYYEYLGIPYATITPEDRFKNVLPTPTWDGIREGIDEDIWCPQRDERGRVVGTEQCLVLNVFVPENSSPPAPLSVMMYIHGGRYVVGSNTKARYGPELFMQENVIVVTFNYRLGILGFLCMDEFANAGVNDAIAVLKWIQANIESFGGDPSRVTIFGNSAGAAIVDMLMTRRTEGLFGGAISQSGLIMMPGFAETISEERPFNIGKKLGYEGRDRQRLLQVFRNASFTELVLATESFPAVGPFDFCPIQPCIEAASIGNGVISSDPLAMITSGVFNDVPYILGVSKNEGLLLYDIIRRVPNYMDLFRKGFSQTIPKELQCPNVPMEEIVESVKSFYFEGKNFSKLNVEDIVEYIGDVVCVVPAVRTARAYARAGRSAPLFLYEFAYDGGLAYFKRHFNVTLAGVGHADELGYLFKLRDLTSDRPDDLLTVQRLLKLWTNFAKFRDPTREIGDLVPVKWEPTEGEDLKYLLIDRAVKMSREPFKARVDFWVGLFKNCSVLL